MQLKSLLLIPIAILSGCGPSERMVSYDQVAGGGPAISGSIFPSDVERAGNEDVARVLDGRVQLKEKGNLAVLPIGQMRFLDAGSGEVVRKEIAAQLSRNRFVGEVIVVPRMLMTDKVSVSIIREMGARLQCENVLVYTAYNDTRYDVNYFSKDEMRVDLTVEAVLINVRTGCIPIAVSIDQSSLHKEAKADHDRYEFLRRAQRECLLSGIRDACTRIAGVLKEVK